MCASFAIPGLGAEAGAAIAGGQFLFDVFYPRDASCNPADLPSSRGDIERATASIAAAIDGAAFVVHRDNVATFAEDFQSIWKRLQARPDGLSPATWNDIAAKMKSQCDRYFNEVTATDNLRNAIRWIESHNCPNDMTGVYLLAMGLTVAFHKTGLNWDINNILEAARREASPMPTMTEMVSTNFHAMTLRDQILPEFIGKVTALRDSWQSRWNDRKSQLDRSHREFLAQNRGSTPCSSRSNGAPYSPSNTTPSPKSWV